MMHYKSIGCQALKKTRHGFGSHAGLHVEWRNERWRKQTLHDFSFQICFHLSGDVMRPVANADAS
jgi:hypothetical protein